MVLVLVGQSKLWERLKPQFYVAIANRFKVSLCTWILVGKDLNLNSTRLSANALICSVSSGALTVHRLKDIGIYQTAS